MTLRGFIFLLVVGVAASIASGLVVERFTAPGLERTLAFAAPVALALYLAGLWGEKRGWISGHAQLGRRRPPDAAAANPPPGARPTTDSSAAGPATGRETAASAATEHAAAPSAPVQGTGTGAVMGADPSAGEPKRR